MRTVAATTAIDDLDDFLAAIESIGAETGATIQCFDAAYVAGERHLRRAVELAARAREQGTAVADDPAVEVLLYAAGRRQIDQALEIGLKQGEITVVGVVDGGDEAAAEARLAALVGTQPASTGSESAIPTSSGSGSNTVHLGDEATLRSFFHVTDEEYAIVDGDIEALVLERVALLDVEK